MNPIQFYRDWRAIRILSRHPGHALYTLLTETAAGTLEYWIDTVRMKYYSRVTLRLASVSGISMEQLASEDIFDMMFRHHFPNEWNRCNAINIKWTDPDAQS